MDHCFMHVHAVERVFSKYWGVGDWDNNWRLNYLSRIRAHEYECGQVLRLCFAKLDVEIITRNNRASGCNVHVYVTCETNQTLYPAFLWIPSMLSVSILRAIRKNPVAFALLVIQWWLVQLYSNPDIKNFGSKAEEHEEEMFKESCLCPNQLKLLPSERLRRHRGVVLSICIIFSIKGVWYRFIVYFRRRLGLHGTQARNRQTLTTLLLCNW